MDSGFFQVGWRESLAVWLAVAIIVDWAAVRYARDPSPRRGGSAGAPSAAVDRTGISEPPAPT